MYEYSYIHFPEVTVLSATISRRLLEGQGFHLAGPLPDTDEVRYTRPVS